MDTLTIATQWPKYPYRGLDFYRETDALLFRERSRDVEECAAILLGFGVKILIARVKRVREIVVPPRWADPTSAMGRAEKFFPWR